MSEVEHRLATLNRIMHHEPGEVGAYTLAGAYNGWQVQQITSKVRGTTALTSGYVSLVQVNQFLSGMIAGIRAARADVMGVKP